MASSVTMLFYCTTLILTVGLCQLPGVRSESEMIAFPSGIRFPTVFPDDDRTDKDGFLFDATDVNNKKLSLSFKVKDFKHSSQSQFRADPTLFKCVQKLQNAMQQEGNRLEIVSGFVPSSAISSSDTHDVYQSTGKAIRIKIKAGGSGSQTKNDLITAAGRYCMPVFEQINRDIGVTDLGDHIQIHIQGPQESGPYYNPSSVGSLVMTGIDQAYDLDGTFTCTADSPKLSSTGDLFPDVASLDEAVGGLEEAITRDNLDDFSKLAQYPANHLVFEDEERSSSWCGTVGTPCNPCASGIAGVALNLRCADRTMTYRLLRVLRSLGKAVSAEWSGVKLKVLEAWDEPHSASSNGDQPQGSLHYEGRAAQVITSDNDAGKLERLSQLAICAGVDAALLNADHLVLAALKQKGTEPRTVTFGDNKQLVEVEPPAAQTGKYKLKEQFSEDEAKEYPLFDSKDRHGLKLSQDVTLGRFVSRDGRYLRLSPQIVSCFQAIIIAELKYGIDPPLQVCRSYLNQVEVESEIDIVDKRYPNAGLGLSMELSNNCSSTADHTNPLDLYDQMDMVVEQCAPIFYRANGRQMGIGLYPNFIAVDMRPSFKAWASHGVLLDGGTEDEFNEYFQRWAIRAIQGRIVDPDDLEEVCLTSVKPSVQDIDFRHKFPVKTFEDDSDEDKCTPDANTAFCTSTRAHRMEEVNRIWTEVKRKHLFHDETEMKAALEDCLLTCDACSEGEFWKKKVEGCNNFIHWVPFEFLNDIEAGDDVNLYLMENVALKHYACQGHCLNKAPLFSLMIPTLAKLYRPKPDESIQEELFSIANNPSPVMEWMHQMYLVSAKGVVKVWVNNEKDLTTLKTPLKYLALFNKNVTKIEIYVAQASNKDIVSGVFQTFYSEWVKQGCLDYARHFLPPFSVSELPPHMSKRSAQFDLREQMLHHHKTWENRWLNGHPLI